jgi:HSP20 family protein
MSRPSARRESARACYGGAAPYTLCLSPTEDRSAFLVDIYETDDALTIEGAAPGARREDIEITVVRDVVTIQVRPRPAPRPTPGRCVRRERYAGGWSRAIELPAPVESSALTWSVTRGVLMLRIRKGAASPLQSPANSPASGSEKEKVEPAPSSDSNRMRPPETRVRSS